MEKALEILKHIEEFYVAEPDLNKFERIAQKNPERVAAWDEAFKDYDLSDVLTAIDEFWNYKSSKSKPSVHQIRALLNVKKDLTPVISEATREEKYTDYAFEYMARDIKLGRNRHLLSIYQRAVHRIVNEVLAEFVETSEFRAMDYSDRCAKAMQLGLFNEFDEILVKICRELYGKDYQY